MPSGYLPVFLKEQKADVIIAGGMGETAQELFNENGIEVVLDDRNERAGFKFKDSDLLGFPLKIVIGKGSLDGVVELKERKSGESIEIKEESVLEYIQNFMKN